MNPLAPAAHDRVADAIHTDVSVVVAAHSEDRRDLAERADQIARKLEESLSDYGFDVQPSRGGIAVPRQLWANIFRRPLADTIIAQGKCSGRHCATPFSCSATRLHRPAKGP